MKPRSRADDGPEELATGGPGEAMSLAALTQKPLVTVKPGDTLVTAARLMCDRSVGALVVTDDSGETPLGIITDRDLVWMVAERLDPKIAQVGQFVRAPLQTACITDSLETVARIMRTHAVRRLPIVDPEHRLVGLVSLDDLLVLLGRELADLTGVITGEIERERGIGAARDAH
jgi:CBS domain-containing protein